MSSISVLLCRNCSHWNSNISLFILLKSAFLYSQQKYKSQRNKVNNMIKYAREQFFLSANELVNSLQSKNSKSYWTFVKRIMKGTGNNYTISIFDNIACVRGTAFGGSLLESLIYVIEQNYWLRRSAFALSSYTNSPVDPLYKGV
jgi:hypothetical protein